MAEDYKPNSHRSKEQEKTASLEERKLEKVISGTAKQRKPNGLSKAASTFLPGDIDSVKTYILMDVLVPSVKRAISDIVCNGINMLLGEPNRSKGNNPAGRVNYRSFYRGDEEDRRDTRPRVQTRYNYSDVIFDNRGDAEAVLDRMEELLVEFQAVSVADFFDMAGIPSQYTDNKYGWEDLRDAQVRRVRDGYIIDLPRATNL